MAVVNILKNTGFYGKINLLIEDVDGDTEQMQKFTNMTEIKRGFSSDRKFCVADTRGCKYFLRISALENAERKATEFEQAKAIQRLGIPMCTPLDFEIRDDGVYSLYSWIDGEDARTALRHLSLKNQYDYGAKAGRIQSILHTLPAPLDTPKWETRYNTKLDVKLEKYKTCPYKYKNGDMLIDYVVSNRHLLANRPSTYQHGDYHVGNMMIGNDGKLYIIDFFDRNDFGDPWEDIKPITWDVAVSPAFANGRINGYFSNNIPIDFWRLLALYVCAGILSSLPWAVPFGNSEVEVMNRLASEVMMWYDNMKNVVPSWFAQSFMEDFFQKMKR